MVQEPRASCPDAVGLPRLDRMGMDGVTASALETPRFDDFLSSESLTLTTRLVFAPHQYLVRVLDSLRLESDGAVRRTSLELKLPPGPVLIPIANPRRSGLIDTLRIESPHMVGESTLGRLDTIHVTRMLLRRSALAAKVDALLPWATIRDVCYRVPAVEIDDSLDIVEEFRKLLLTRLPDGMLDSHQAQFVSALQFFSYRRLLLLPCRATDRLTKVSYETDVSPHEFRLESIREGLRAIFGRLPDDHVLDIPLANKAQSYHFRMRAPDSHFIRTAACFRRISGSLAQGQRIRRWEVAEYRPTNHAHSGLRPDATGLCHVHLVNVGLNDLAKRGLLLRVRIAERPLGQLGATFARLLAVLGACIYIALYGQGFVTNASTALTSLFVGLPGLLGISIFLSGGRNSRGPLLARAGSLIASSGAIALALIMVSWTTLAAHRKDPKSDHFAATHGVWIALMIVLTILAAMSALNVSALVRNSRRFYKARTMFISQRRDSAINV